METTIVWFRQDLRLADNPALHAAAQRGAVVPVYIWSPDEEAPWAPGGATRVWMHESLGALDASLRAIGSRLVLREGPADAALFALARETNAQAVHWNRQYEPAAIARDKKVKAALNAASLRAESFKANLLFEPWEVMTGEERPYRVFTPFWNACQAKPGPAAPIDAPEKLSTPSKWPASLPLDSLGLLPEIPWDAGIRDAWTPGEAGAQQRMDTFVVAAMVDYESRRDTPSQETTSLLSPHLHFGEMGPRTIWHACKRAAGGRGKAALPYLRQIVWREFAHHVLYHFPHTTTAPMRSEFADFPWHHDATRLHAWQRGRTGYPIVDAGMRQLWETGWMHNRVRMIAASFLVKDLHIHWLDGARWFWDTLVDADLANNSFGWQWTAGCGADAAPYFRIFNPVLQGAKFDPKGDYVRRWVPELAALPAKWIHNPWEAPAETLSKSGMHLGETYPHPIVDHADARATALEYFQRIKKT
jgi:deoxyribodipyrimidine photo-lyase